MPRQPSVDPRVALLFRMPQSLKTKLDLYLYSPLEGRVPFGAHSKLLCGLIEEYLAKVETPNDPVR